ncbi:MAG: hypothetical protein WCX31_22365 [Salinivirgaceae bacterium]
MENLNTTESIDKSVGEISGESGTSTTESSNESPGAGHELNVFLGEGMMGGMGALIDGVRAWARAAFMHGIHLRYQIAKIKEYATSFNNNVNKIAEAKRSLSVLNGVPNQSGLGLGTTTISEVMRHMGSSDNPLVFNNGDYAKYLMSNAIADLKANYKDFYYGGTAPLTGGAVKVLGNLKNMSELTLRAGVLARGGKAGNLNVVATWLHDMTIGEVAGLAAKGEKEAMTGIKILKQASKKAQKY